MSVCRELGQRDSSRAPWIGAWRRLPAAWVLGLDKVEQQLAVRIAYKRMGQGRNRGRPRPAHRRLRPGSTNPANAAVTQAHTKITALREREATRSAEDPHDPVPGRTRPAGRTRRPNAYRP
jgi:hypothetical protein